MVSHQASFVSLHPSHPWTHKVLLPFLGFPVVSKPKRHLLASPIEMSNGPIAGPGASCGWAGRLGGQTLAGPRFLLVRVCRSSQMTGSHKH